MNADDALVIGLKINRVRTCCGTFCKENLCLSHLNFCELQSTFLLVGCSTTNGPILNCAGLARPNCLHCIQCSVRARRMSPQSKAMYFPLLHVKPQESLASTPAILLVQIQETCFSAAHPGNA